MKKQQFLNLVKWIKEQIEFADRLIDESKESKNYGKETLYSGMKEAYIKMLQQLPENI